MLDFICFRSKVKFFRFFKFYIENIMSEFFLSDLTKKIPNVISERIDNMFENNMFEKKSSFYKLHLKTSVYGCNFHKIYKWKGLKRFWRHTWKTLTAHRLRNTAIYRVCHGFRLTYRDDFFESILTTFELSFVFWGSRGSTENQLMPTKFEPQPS